jgi:hypothetical protein
MPLNSRDLVVSSERVPIYRSGGPKTSSRAGLELNQAAGLTTIMLQELKAGSRLSMVACTAMAYVR